MKKISCIIPTYNEGLRIEGILCTVVEHELVHEVIVVDDGSKDNTKDIVYDVATRHSKLRLIVHEKNTGKSGAVATGIREATGDYVMFIDADLIGVTKTDLTNLIEPVIDNKADVTISLRKNAPAPWQWIGLDYISGERVMPRDFVLPFIDDFTKIPKFGLESYLNSEIIKEESRIKIVKWPDVESPWKYKKAGLIKGIWGDIKMIGDIFRTITPIGPIYQIIQMKRLEIK